MPAVYCRECKRTFLFDIRAADEMACAHVRALIDQIGRGPEPEPPEVETVTGHLLDALSALEAHVPPSREATKAIRQMRAGLRRLGRDCGRMLAENARLRAGQVPVVDDAGETVAWVDRRR